QIALDRLFHGLGKLLRQGGVLHDQPVDIAAVAPCLLIGTCLGIQDRLIDIAGSFGKLPALHVVIGVHHIGVLGMKAQGHERNGEGDDGPLCEHVVLHVHSSVPSLSTSVPASPPCSSPLSAGVVVSGAVSSTGGASLPAIGNSTPSAISSFSFRSLSTLATA